MAMDVNEAIAVINILAMNSELIQHTSPENGTCTGRLYNFAKAKNNGMEGAMQAAYAAELEVTGTGPNSFIIWL